uniref:Secreted protein n=1 Tax=Micrurus spixii TaxID=129469 RepID=A0A2D4M7Z8_9SAUR
MRKFLLYNLIYILLNLYSTFTPQAQSSTYISSALLLRANELNGETEKENKRQKQNMLSSKLVSFMVEAGFFSPYFPLFDICFCVSSKGVICIFFKAFFIVYRRKISAH